MPQSDSLNFGDTLEALFQRASDLDPSARTAFLDLECAGNERLREAVEELLEASTAADSNPGWSQSALMNEALCSSGIAESQLSHDRYKLIERIGSGGMGVVYKAVRADDVYSKVVAIKVVDEAGAGKLLSHFRTERQILAGLEHPNIARLLDGGSTSAGLPFLVMEYVDGVPVDQYVRDRQIPAGEILDLFRKICSAVSCAHSQLVVHRDLKPANILVTPAGEPKLLDFGIARLIDGAGDSTLIGRALTPQYASPEQIRGEAVAIATDVYSLGVLLYQLLSGTLPYGELANPVDLARAICEAPPRRLSELDSELEMILQMALRKEPARRYQSVEQFSEDLRRYLEGYPVRARPDTRAYRAKKFLRRSRLTVSTGVIVTLTLIGGIVSTTAERRRAEAAEFRTRRALYAAHMNLAFQGWEAGSAGRVLDLLEAQKPGKGQEDLRGFEWFLLWRLAHAGSRVLAEPPEISQSVEFSPDGRTIVASTNSGKARVWDATSGRLERSFDFSGDVNVAFFRGWKTPRRGHRWGGRHSPHRYRRDRRSNVSL
jgi:eukaryotic-like serine/threonine-protein kinase